MNDYTYMNEYAQLLYLYEFAFLLHIMSSKEIFERNLATFAKLNTKYFSAWAYA